MADGVELTPAQEAAIRDRWITIGLQTRKYDKQAVPELMARIYKEGDLPPPRSILHVASPIAANAVINLLQRDRSHPLQEVDVSIVQVDGVHIRSATVTDETQVLRDLCRKY